MLLDTRTRAPAWSKDDPIGAEHAEIAIGEAPELLMTWISVPELAL